MSYSEISDDLDSEVAQVAEEIILPLLSSSYTACYDADEGNLTIHCSENVIMTVAASGFMLLSGNESTKELNFNSETDWQSELADFVKNELIPQLALDCASHSIPQRLGRVR